MDIVLHKRLLALQAENSMLKEEIQKLQEVLDTPEARAAYRDAATTNIRDIMSWTRPSPIETEPTDAQDVETTGVHADTLRRRGAGLTRLSRREGFPVKLVNHRDRLLKPGEARTHQTLHFHKGKHYVISSNDRETLIFPSDKDGNWESIEVGRGDSPQQHNDNGTIEQHHMDTFRRFMAENP